MKKEKLAITITLGITCFAFVMVIFMQFKMVYQTDITSIETMREEELEGELASYKNKYEETEKKYKEVTETLNKYKEESSSDSETRKNLEEELQNLKLMLGTTEVQGNGIIINLDDSNVEVREDKINADELMIIVNYLKDAGAEAIEINGQRIVNATYFAYINNSYVKVNNKRLSSPYTIKVIGDQDYLRSALIGADGYVERSIKPKGQTISFENKKKLTILKYEGSDLTTKYIDE